MQPPVTQSCSESALVSLGAPKAPALTRPQAVVLAVAAPRKVDQKGMFVADGPGRGGGRLGGRMLGITVKSASGVTFRPQERGVCAQPSAGSFRNQEPGTHACVSRGSPPTGVFSARPVSPD